MKNIFITLPKIIILCIFLYLMQGCTNDDFDNNSATINLFSPCTIWGISQSDVKTYMSNNETSHEDSDILVYKREDKERVVSYAFEDNSLCATTMFVKSSDISMSALSSLFSGYDNISPFNGSFAGYLSTALNTYGEISVVSSANEMYYCVGWSIYKDNVDSVDSENYVIKYMTSNLKAINITTMLGFGANIVSHNYNASTNFGTITFDGPYYIHSTKRI